MNANDNYGKQNHIYDKQTRTWFEVTPEQFKEYDRWRTRVRKREQYHGRCMCPRSKWWLCDGMCQDCEYRASGDTISLDAPITNEDGDEVTLADTLMDLSSLFVSAMCDKEELRQLLARLDRIPSASIPPAFLQTICQSSRSRIRDCAQRTGTAAVRRS